jgi:ankyrin repeat protein
MLDKVEAELKSTGSITLTFLHDVLLDLNKGDKTSLNTKGQAGFTALYAAVGTDDVSIVKLLIEQGADINGVSLDNRTPLYLAAMRDQEDIVDYLLSQGADKTIANKSNGYTPYQRVKENYNQGGKSNPVLKRLEDKLKP